MAHTDHDTDFAAFLCQPANRAHAYIEQLRTEQSQLTDQLTTAQAKLTETSETCAAAQLERDKASENSAALDLDRNQLREDLENAKEVNDSLKMQCESHDSALRQLNEAKLNAESDGESAVAELAEKGRIIFDLEQDNKELKCTRSTLKDTVELKEEANAVLRREKASLASQCDTLSTQIDKLKKDLVHRDNRLSASRSEQDKLSKQVQSNQVEIKRLQSENNKQNFKRDIITTKDRRIHELEDTIAGLQADKDGASEKLRSARDDHNATKQKLSDIKAACHDAETERDTLAAHLERVEAEQKQLNQDLNDVDSRLQQARVQLENADHHPRLDPRLQCSTSIQIHASKQHHFGDGTTYVQCKGVRYNEAAIGPFYRPEPIEPTDKHGKAWEEYRPDEITFAVGRAPDHSIGARALCRVSKVQITTHELRCHFWALSAVDLSCLPLDVVDGNIGYQDLPREGRVPVKEQRQTQSAKPLPSKETHESNPLTQATFGDPFMPTPTSTRRSVSSTGTAREAVLISTRKRAQSRSPERRLKAVCRPCRLNKTYCSSNGQCGECKLQAIECVYRECVHGQQCRDPRCTMLHPDQWDSPQGIWSTDKPQPGFFKKFASGK